MVTSDDDEDGMGLLTWVSEVESCTCGWCDVVMVDCDCNEGFEYARSDATTEVGIIRGGVGMLSLFVGVADGLSCVGGMESV